MPSSLPSPSCPFCRIASSHPPIPPLLSSLPKENNTSLSNHDAPLSNTFSRLPAETMTGTHTHLILSTGSVLAFLDIMPLTKGHVLLVTRDHYEKLGDLNVGTGREVGQWLPVLSRVVMRTIFGTEADADAHWNVVQNNGIRAAQQVPHLHFHIIPRPPLDAGRSAPRPSFTMFGRGQRDELDDDEGEVLAKVLREELVREIKRVRDEEGVDLEDSGIPERRERLGKL